MGEIQTWIGLDVGKADHHATVIDAASEIVVDRGVCNDEKAIEQLLAAAGEHAVLVIDQPGSIGSLAVAVARRRGSRWRTCQGWSCARHPSSIPVRRRPTGATAS